MNKILNVENLTVAYSKIDNKDQNIFLQFLDQIISLVK